MTQGHVLHHKYGSLVSQTRNFEPSSLSPTPFDWLGFRFHDSSCCCFSPWVCYCYIMQTSSYWVYSRYSVLSRWKLMLIQMDRYRVLTKRDHGVDLHLRMLGQIATISSSRSLFMPVHLLNEAWNHLDFMFGGELVRKREGLLEEKKQWHRENGMRLSLPCPMTIDEKHGSYRCYLVKRDTQTLEIW